MKRRKREEPEVGTGRIRNVVEYFIQIPFSKQFTCIIKCLQLPHGLGTLLLISQIRKPRHKSKTELGRVQGLCCNYCAFLPLLGLSLLHNLLKEGNTRLKMLVKCHLREISELTRMSHSFSDLCSEHSVMLRGASGSQACHRAFPWGWWSTLGPPCWLVPST